MTQINAEVNGHVIQYWTVGECTALAGLNGTEYKRLPVTESTAMTSQNSDNEKPAHPTDNRPPTMPSKIQVQQSFSKESIAIHFSAFGTEEEEDAEELCMTTNFSPPMVQHDPNIVSGLEAGEDVLKERVNFRGEYDVLEPNRSFAVLSSQVGSAQLLEQSSEPIFSNSTPTKSLSFPSIDKPFFSLIRASSSDIQSRDTTANVATPTVRNRTFKTLVKSLSSDPPQDSPPMPHRLPESRLNLQLFKQFAQSRIPTVITSSSNDSRTVPSSPAVSPDNRSFFKVAEVEAKLEDTKRRLSEVIYEPLQLLSKIMDEKGSNSLYRPKSMSASTSELATITSDNGLAESNNNYCIKEEEDDVLEAGKPTSATSSPAESLVSPSSETKSPNKSLLTMSLENCSMSALAKQEYEDFCVLYSEDFANDANPDLDHIEADVDTKSTLCVSSESYGDDESECSMVAPTVPCYSLTILTLLVYVYFLIPLPNYIGGMLLGIALGFFLAIGAVWLTGPTPSGSGSNDSKYHRKLWGVSRLDIREPDIYKGWMNEISNYDPETYHATLTHSVYVRLEGSVIRLSKPNHNISRRATHNQPKPDVTFISQKIYDLTNSKVSLVPPNLARKRLWNKKYPIRIELGHQDYFMSKTEGDKYEVSDGASVRDRDWPGGSSDRSVSTRDLTLYLFGRTGKEKEEWFQRLLVASKPKTALKKSKNALNSHSQSSSRSSLEDALAAQPRIKDSGASAKTSLLDYCVYMASLLPKRETVTLIAASPTFSSPHSSPGADKKLPSSTFAPAQCEVEDDSGAWLNASLGRIAWDFLTEPYWTELVSKKIQMKLSKIRLPYFMNELTLTELDMGAATPRITGASKPSIDYRGLWFDLDVSYSGSFLMTLETKMNLIRLGKEGENFRMGEFGKDGSRPRTYCLADSDEESSSAGSSNEEDSSELSNDPAGAESLVGGHKPSKIMRFVDKITKSKYFQKATETEFIKKKMEEVSNTPLLLTVEVQELRGTLAVNIPPPPTDRIWYGFRKPPHLELKARPKLGEREVTLAHVTDWIEKKLDQEFQKIFVMPNMDDVWLSIMHSAMDQRSYTGAPVIAEPETNATSQP